MLKKSTTLYVGNLSFYTTEEQIFDLFSKVGEIKRIIMGLDRFKKTPCGFCFVEYYRRIDAEKSVKFISNTKLDERTIRVDYDTGFTDGRQYGRGRSGGQVRDEHRMDYDPGRGGFGKAMAPQTGMSGMDMWGNSNYQNGDGYNSGSYRRGGYRGRGRGRRPFRGRPNFRDRGGFAQGPGAPPPFMDGGKRRRTDDFEHEGNFQKRQRITGYPNMPMHANGHPRFGPPPHAMPPHNGNHMMHDGPMPPQRPMPHGQPVPPHRPGPPQVEPARNEKFDRGRKDDE